MPEDSPLPLVAGLAADQLDADWRESDADRFKFCIFGALKPRAIGTGNPTRAISPSLPELSRPPTWGFLRTCI